MALVPTPAVGAVQALFDAPPGDRNLRRVRDPDILWELIDVTQVVLMESELTGRVLRTQLATVDSRVVDESNRSICFLWALVRKPPFWFLTFCFWRVGGRATGSSCCHRGRLRLRVRPRGNPRGAPPRGSGARPRRGGAPRGVFRGASVALAIAQIRFEMDLHFLVGFPQGQGAADHESLVNSFEEAADAVVAEVPADEIIREAH